LPETIDWDNDGDIDDYLDANEAIDWLRGTYNHVGVQTGPQKGWTSVDADKAAQLASQGFVVIAAWKNPVIGQHGHMALVRPESQPGKILIAQAGSSNFESGTLNDGFGDRQVEFFVYKPPQTDIINTVAF
jgi:hypothetical protein